MLSVFKSDVLKSVFEHYDKFYLHMAPHDDLVIGSRGLIGEENERGIVLVFGSESFRSSQLADTYLTVDMRFAGKWENLFIPYDSIISVFNDPVNPEFMFNFKPLDDEEYEEEIIEEKPKIDYEKTDNVIKLDFNKEKKN